MILRLMIICLDPVLDLDQAFQKERIKRTALPIHDHAHGLLMRERFLVYTRTHQGIVNIYNGNHLGCDRDFFSL